MFADDVDPAGRAGHEVGGLAVGRLELREEVVPALALRGQRVGGVDLVQRPGEGDGAGHGGGGLVGSRKMRRTGRKVGFLR